MEIQSVLITDLKISFKDMMAFRIFPACVDGCVDVLLDEIEALIREVESVNMTNIVSAPWPMLDKIRREHRTLVNQLNHYQNSGGRINGMLLDLNLELRATDLLRRVRFLEEEARRNKPPAVETLNEAMSLIDLLNVANQRIEGEGL